ncbi:MAG: hypothetical protein LQ338_005462 [Usnochroma carphineum]|nr:MAG: hypothetical protein LQ338_005462 [Usnochroma carphineum]
MLSTLSILERDASSSAAAMKADWSLCLLLAWMSTLLACVVALPLEDARRTASVQQPPQLSTPEINYPRKQRRSNLHSLPYPRTRARKATKNHPHRQLSSRGSGGSELLPSHPFPGHPGTSYSLSSKVFINHSLIVPITLAAEWMTHFFELVAQRIETGYWAHQPASNYLKICIWDFELEFYSLTSIIPWDFVQDYVFDTLQYIERGFTGVYSEHMVGTINGAVATVSVGFRLLQGPAG